MLSVQNVQFLGKAMSNGRQNGVCEGHQPQPQLQLPVSRTLPSSYQPQTHPPPLSVQEQQQQLQRVAQQVQALCRTISAAMLDSGLNEIDATMMLSQLGEIEDFARIAKKAVRNANAQHPISPPAQRLCRQVCSCSLACAASRSVMLTRRYRDENSRNAVEATAIS